ncbi:MULTISPECIES: hypothetical protein [unclassified Curtobacterium]|uniref:hypothetical protein n=1 Tax=unclassified Curtobacterium TaxID=257496 RepID=UPI0011B7E8F4|nr:MULTISPECIES: hypothetical protein [unclassified Curtobacterium]
MLLSMKRWIRIPAVVVGAAATAYGCLYLSPLLTGWMGAATLWMATTRWSSGEPIDLPAGTEVDPTDVRKYREDHPGLSIERAVAAVAGALAARPSGHDETRRSTPNAPPTEASRASQ